VVVTRDPLNVGLSHSDRCNYNPENLRSDKDTDHNYDTGRICSVVLQGCRLPHCSYTAIKTVSKECLQTISQLFADCRRALSSSDFPVIKQSKYCAVYLGLAERGINTET
jgi:hypothetical protein